MNNCKKMYSGYMRSTTCRGSSVGSGITKHRRVIIPPRPMTDDELMRYILYGEY